jgi:hypothetical protein
MVAASLRNPPAIPTSSFIKVFIEALSTQVPDYKGPGYKEARDSGSLAAWVQTQAG